MNFSFKKVLPHILVILGFIVVSLLYFNPVLSGKMLYQNDIKLYQSMAKQHTDFRAETGTETYWTNGAFGGMPTYQMGAHFPHDYMDKLDKLIRFLPRPADYLFLYLLSFYVLMLVMRVPWKLAILGALAFGFSTYLIIIIGVGHNAKAHAIAYFPLVLSGILLTFQKRYVWGFLLTAVAMGLEVQANHYQMTYYLGFLVVILGIAYLVDAFKKKQLQHYFKTIGILVVAVAMGLAMNATTILSTAEYAKTSIRGEKLLTSPNDAAAASKDGLDYNYITHYSYGKLESFNLLAPKLMGLGRASDLGSDSAFYKKLIELGVPADEANYYAQTTPLYWGEQPYVAAPPYLGITVVLLALLGLFLIKGRLRWWIIGGIALSLLLSWGKNFEGLTRFFIEYVPFYNKFRAVTSIQVLIEFVIPIAAAIGLYRFFNDREDASNKLKKLAIATGILGGLCLIFYLFGGSLFALRSAAEGQMAIKQPEILNAIKADRLTILRSDVLRSLLFVIAVAAVLWLELKKKLSENTTIILLGLLIVIDLVGVDRRNVDEDGFMSKREYQKEFTATPVDEEILKDKNYYRVYDEYRGFNNSHVSYFHNTINGYSAVYPRRIDDIRDQIVKDDNVGVLNMLNVKYIIKKNEGNMFLQRNPYVNGPAWYVEELQTLPDYNTVYDALNSIDTKRVAVIRLEDAEGLSGFAPKKDSLASVAITQTLPNSLSYTVSNKEDGFIVFSEAYYEKGWVATIDGQESPIYPVNYMLRGLKVPAGDHTIAFTFDPPVVKKGGMIMLTSSLLLMLLLLGVGVKTYLDRSKETKA